MDKYRPKKESHHNLVKHPGSVKDNCTNNVAPILFPKSYSLWVLINHTLQIYLNVNLLNWIHKSDIYSLKVNLFSDSFANFPPKVNLPNWCLINHCDGIRIASTWIPINVADAANSAFTFTFILTSLSFDFYFNLFPLPLSSSSIIWIVGNWIPINTLLLSCSIYFSFISLSSHTMACIHISILLRTNWLPQGGKYTRCAPFFHLAGSFTGSSIAESRIRAYQWVFCDTMKIERRKKQEWYCFKLES